MLGMFNIFSYSTNRTSRSSGVTFPVEVLGSFVSFLQFIRLPKPLSQIVLLERGFKKRAAFFTSTNRHSNYNPPVTQNRRIILAHLIFIHIHSFTHFIPYYYNRNRHEGAESSHSMKKKRKESGTETHEDYCSAQLLEQYFPGNISHHERHITLLIISLLFNHFYSSR